MEHCSYDVFFSDGLKGNIIFTNDLTESTYKTKRSIYISLLFFLLKVWRRSPNACSILIPFDRFIAWGKMRSFQMCYSVRDLRFKIGENLEVIGFQFFVGLAFYRTLIHLKIPQ